MKKFIKWLVFEYNSIHNSVSFWMKKREANRLHYLTGKRYHVIPRDDRRLQVVDNTFINAYNSQMPKAKRITIVDLIKMSYYSTSVEGLNRKK